jgi:CelD/BcsL family acetyltransferase involved in cellulose biosynthesis
VARSDLSVTTDLDSLAWEWEQLAERTGGSPFLRPGWILPWLRAFGTGTPEAIVVRRHDELVGVLAMQRRRGRLYSLANWHSPLFGPLVADAEARDLLLEHLFDQGGPAVELSLLDGDCDVTARIDRSAREAGRVVLGRAIAACPVIEIGGTFEDYERGLSRNRRRSLRRGRRQLEAQGEVSFHVHDGLDVLDEVLRLEASGWKGERETAIVSRPETERFYTDVARWAAARGWLRLSLLRLDGEAIACDYSIEFAGAWWSLKSGYDERHRHCGPGALLLREQLSHCFERGACSLQLLGTADSFKRSWTERSCERTRVHAFARSPAGLVAWSRVAARERVRPTVHWVRLRVRDQVARGQQAIASLAATFDGVGLEALPLAA